MRTPAAPAPQTCRRGADTNKKMLDVVLALLPAAAACILLYGLGALWVLLTCVAGAVTAEAVYNLCVGKKQTIGDLSAVVTGLLLGMSLNGNVPLWQCAVGAVFAVVVIKGFFGGLGKNIVNPAVAAFVFLMISFDTVGRASEPAPLFQLDALGEFVPVICGGALLLGYLYLVLRRVIQWYVPAAFVATVFVSDLLLSGFDVALAGRNLLTGGLLLGAIFMTTDPVTTPRTGAGRVIFCICAGLISIALRRYGAHPAATFAAILTMNLLVPFIPDWSKKLSAEGKKLLKIFAILLVIIALFSGAMFLLSRYIGTGESGHPHPVGSAAASCTQMWRGGAQK